jgi:RND family efflux transporter MFP subunit
MQPWSRVVRTQGSLVGDEHAVIGAKVAGRVKSVHADLGSSVKEGDRLAALDVRDFELQVQQAQAQLAQACAVIGLGADEEIENLDATRTPAVLMEKALLDEARENLQRAQQLSKTKSISDVELQRQIAAERVAQARYELALNTIDENIALVRVRRSQLALSQQNLADGIVLAPFAGVIQQRHVAVGAYLQIGDPVATLVRTDPLRFRSGVPERKATQLRTDQEVRIFLEDESQPIISRITRISPALDMSSRSLVIEADLPNPEARWRAGLFAEAEIVVAADDQTLAVPAAAVSEFAGVQKVWVVQDGEARQQRVQTGRQNADMVEILAGLEVGQLVIADSRQGRAGKVTTTTFTSADAGIVER